MKAQLLLCSVNAAQKTSAPDATAAPLKCSSRTYQSWHELTKNVGEFEDNRPVIVIDVDTEAMTAETFPPAPHAGFVDKSLAASRADDFQDQDHSPPIMPFSKSRQISVQAIGAEFRRLAETACGRGRVEVFRRRLEELSSRQMDVLILMMQGKSCKEISARLDVGFATIAKHRAQILKKLNVKNPIELYHLLNANFH